MWVWLKLTIIKLASRKNIMSINGMISMRARLCGTGEESLILIRGACHGKGNGDVDSGNCSRSKSPLSKGAGGGIIQYGTSSAFRDGSARDVAAGCVDCRDDHSTARDVSRTRLVGILGTRGVQSKGFRFRHRHRPGGFDWHEFLSRLLWWARWRCS